MAMNARRRLTRRQQVGLGLLALLVLVLAVFAYLALVPPNLGAIGAQADPAADYAAALQKLAALQSQESGLNPDCGTQLLTHGQATERVIVFFHGYTNCPKQFAALGQQFYDRGYNVLLARLPHHGLADPLTDDLTNMTAEELAQTGDQVVDVAAGLGDRLTVAGISGGGVVTAWVAEHRPEVDLAVLISPGFGFQALPAPATVLVVNTVLLQPDNFVWWDPSQPAPDPASPLAHAYPRYSRHGLAQILRLSLAAQGLARRSAPLAAALLVVTNAHDDSVDNAVTARVAADWQAHGAQLRTYEFPLELGLSHDLIDPGQPDQQNGLVYPQLITLIDQ